MYSITTLAYFQPEVVFRRQDDFGFGSSLWINTDMRIQYSLTGEEPCLSPCHLDSRWHFERQDQTLASCCVWCDVMWYDMIWYNHVYWCQYMQLLTVWTRHLPPCEFTKTVLRLSVLKLPLNCTCNDHGLYFIYLISHYFPWCCVVFPKFKF